MSQNIESFYKDKHILITGGLGMIGSSVAHKAVAMGANVTIVDAVKEPYGANYFNVQSIQDNIQIVVADIRDKVAMKEAVLGKDIVFNFAAQVSHNDSIADPFLDADINYIGHLNVLECIRLVSPEAIVINSGSRLQYGPILYNPVDESHPLDPKTPYAFNKVVAENMYKYYYNIHNIQCVLFRIANPYGIRCQMKHAKYSIINFFIGQAMKGNTITIFGDGEQKRDYIFNEDMSDAFLIAAATPSAYGQVFNLGSGIGTKFSEMAQTIVDIVGKGTVQFVEWPTNYLNVETGDYISNISKITTALPWKPTTNLQEGITKTIEYYQQYSQHYF
jgi:UDP-glucose 4-epimerase